MTDIIDEFYDVTIEQDFFGVSPSEAERLEAALRAGDPIIEITDTYGARHVIAARTFLHMHHSTPEYRAAVREHNWEMARARREHKQTLGWVVDDNG